MERVVVHLKDGSLIRGTVARFPPRGSAFDVAMVPGSTLKQVDLGDVKAVFFVKQFRGRPGYRESKTFPGPPGSGLSGRVRVLCVDGEVLVGYCPLYQSGQAGLFLYPPDRKSNNERVYLLASAIRKLEFV
ncbi:MAG: DUF6982 domain-containing protein [Thermoanaerobaculia bacterium]